MPAPPAIDGLRLPALLSAIASADPAPGAGAAGAVALALGIACARKALRISMGHHPADASLHEAEATLSAMGLDAVMLGQEDACGFAALMAAIRRPQGGGDRKAARAAAIAQATAALCETSRRLVTLCDAAVARLEAVALRVEDSMAGDVSAARALIAAARSIHVANLAEAERPRH